jgi:hypothetical protein
MTEGRDVPRRDECRLEPDSDTLDKGVNRVQLLLSGRKVCALLSEGFEGCVRS